MATLRLISATVCSIVLSCSNAYSDCPFPFPAKPSDDNIRDCLAEVGKLRADLSRLQSQSTGTSSLIGLTPIGGGTVEVNGTDSSTFGGLEFVPRKPSGTTGKYEVAFAKPLARRPIVLVGATQRAVFAVVARQDQLGFEIGTWGHRFATTETLGQVVPLDSGFWFLVFDSPSVKP